MRKNLAWAGDKEETPSGPRENNWFGTDEFLHLCESLNIEPLININLGSGTSEEAHDWLEYVNGDINTEYGKQRVLNGHPKPYNVKYWGIGNESWGNYEIGYFKTGAEYAKKYLEFAHAMKSVDPTIKLLAVGSVPALMGWNKDALENAGLEIDFLSLHIYFPGLSLVRMWGKNKKTEYYGIMAAGRELEKIMDDFDAQIKKYSPQGANIRLALDEWNLWATEQQIVRAEDYEFSAALFVADVLMRLIRRGDKVGFANFAQLVNVLPLIVTDRKQGIFVTPGYYSFDLFRNYLKGNILVETKVESPVFTNREYGIVRPRKDNSLVESITLTDENKSHLDIVIINKHYDSGVKTHIELSNTSSRFSQYKKCELFEINANSPHDMNTFDNPNAIKGIIKRTCPPNNNSVFEHTLPPHSVTLISIDE